VKTIEYRTIDKTSWGPGPYQDEPDKVQFADEATGLPCLIRRVEALGSLCGYVGVPEGHPWHGQDYDNVDADVHGGLTFAGAGGGGDEATSICHKPEPDEPDTVYWLGFDCGHGGDLFPAMQSDYAQAVAMMSAIVGGTGIGRRSSGAYRDLAYVKSELASLARQAARAARAASDPYEEGRYGKGGPGTHAYMSFRD
jgi:hypothetical protein